MGNMLHREYFTGVELPKDDNLKLVKAKSVFADEPKHFSLLYKYKLERHREVIPFIKEVRFIDLNLKECDIMLKNCEECIENNYSKDGSFFADYEIAREVELINEWRDYLNACKDNIQKTVKAEVVIATMNLKQPYLTQEDINSINSNMQLTITRNFEYFRDEYNSDWDRTLYLTYEEITRYYYLIGNTREAPQIKLLYNELQSYQAELRIRFQSFYRFFEFLIFKNMPNDCLIFLNFIRRSIVDYNEMLNQSRYNFSRSYFYDTINECYSDMEIKYNAERLKLVTINSSNGDNFSIKFKKGNSNKFKSISDLFVNGDWVKYVDLLTTCTPQLLQRKGNAYFFVGNESTQKGCIASYFKFLKASGVIKSTCNRFDMSEVLSREIKNYKVSPASIDNKSTLYRKVFATQLENVF